MSAADDQPVRRLVVPGLLALGRLAPWRDWVTASRAAALTAAMRVIDRVHRDTAHGRPPAEPAAAARLADDDVLLIRVGHRADRCPAFRAHHAKLSGGKAQQGITLV